MFKDSYNKIILLLKETTLLGNSIYIVNKGITQAFELSVSDYYLNEYSSKIEKSFLFYPKLQAIIKIDSWLSVQISYLDKNLIEGFISKAEDLNLQIIKTKYNN